MRERKTIIKVRNVYAADKKGSSTTQEISANNSHLSVSRECHRHRCSVRHLVTGSSGVNMRNDIFIVQDARALNLPNPPSVLLSLVEAMSYSMNCTYAEFNKYLGVESPKSMLPFKDKSEIESV